ncbi:hypothetical protein B0H14DRAFT_582348 [Mycena olivaceomarginata]|nr:hypothetical protein B0H14DRAFT_582348 [Mycena olivaceomarginata]
MYDSLRGIYAHKYRRRHPNIMQLFGLVNAKGIRAMVFDDELIPYRQFLSRFQYSPVLTTYIRGYCCTEWKEAIAYCHSVLGTCKNLVYWALWIRPTTGELCVDLVPTTNMDRQLVLDWRTIHVPHLEDLSLESPDAEAILISNFHEGDYHELCALPPVAKFRPLLVSTRLPIDWLGSIIFRSNSTWIRLTEPLRLGGYQGPLTWNHFTRECEPKS